MEIEKIDPKIFINPHYIKCPKCGKESFGILMICPHHYCRRCRECFYPRGDEPCARYPLPKLNKKIIYIDQFAISNMMKALNPETKAYKKGTIKKFWLKLFERLDKLSKLQLIVCPYSESHRYESLAAPFYNDLKRMYELLSHGIEFHDFEAIQRGQIYLHTKNWLCGKEDEEIMLDIHYIVEGDVNRWQERYIISVKTEFAQNIIDYLRKERSKTHDGLNKVFYCWQKEKDKKIFDRFEEIAGKFGRKILSNFPKYSLYIITIQRAIKEEGFTNNIIQKKTKEYLNAPSLKNIPFIKIYSLLYAAIARKASSGMKHPPNQGTARDIQAISTLLPYCDAMFIDKECNSYLKEQPLCEMINYDTKIFSLNNKNEFLKYLDEIESNASKEHLEKIEEVYGKDWAKPYTPLYKN